MSGLLLSAWASCDRDTGWSLRIRYGKGHRDRGPTFELLEGELEVASSVVTTDQSQRWTRLITVKALLPRSITHWWVYSLKTAVKELLVPECRAAPVAGTFLFVE